MKSRERVTHSLVSFPSTFRLNNFLLSLYAIQHQKNQPQNVDISSYQIFGVSFIMHRYDLFTILHLKELCHEIQPNYVITKCPLN